MEATQVKTGLVRFSYAHVFKAKAANENAEPKFSVCLLIPKSDTETVKRIEAAIASAWKLGESKMGGKVPKVYKNPLRDGDEEKEAEEYKGMYFINANSNKKPGIIDSKRLKIVEDPEMSMEDDVSEEEFYSGCWGKVSLNFFAYNASGNKGVGCGLNNILKLKDDTRLSGGKSALEDFGDDDFELMDDEI